MPSYDYECAECKKTFEFFQKMSDEPLTVCPECGGRIHRILTSDIGISFKGSGFYVNDSKKSSSPQGSSAQKSPAQKPAAKKAE